MRPEEVKALLRRQPFVPLRFHITDGRAYDVRQPDQVIVLKGAVDIGVNPDPSSGIVEQVERCSLFHLVRVEELPPVPFTSQTKGAASA